MPVLSQSRFHLALLQAKGAEVVTALLELGRAARSAAAQCWQDLAPWGPCHCMGEVTVPALGS